MRVDRLVRQNGIECDNCSKFFELPFKSSNNGVTIYPDGWYTMQFRQYAKSMKEYHFCSKKCAHEGTKPYDEGGIPDESDDGPDPWEEDLPF